MSRANFSPISAKPTFGNKQNYYVYTSDYITNKKIKYQMNNSNTKSTTNSIIFNYPFNYQRDSTQGNLILFNQYRYPRKNYNSFNLNSGLYTKLNLKNVNVLETTTNPTITPTSINPQLTTPFYENYIIDPNGSLFGNTQCGINNYINFRTSNIS